MSDTKKSTYKVICGLHSSVYKVVIVNHFKNVIISLRHYGHLEHEPLELQKDSITEFCFVIQNLGMYVGKRGLSCVVMQNIH